ncbi:MAG TPA: hypothetical protein PKL76_21310, partial [Phycisphaerae bacterium]|nr:hypothetical protein [Phycisphaerae bacterium]
ESAEAGGDIFATGPSLAVNGIGTIAAALFGSCFPTTIYIGHPGWKAMGARAGYSWLNGLAMTAICLTGTVAAISKIVPIEAGIPIVLWIGIVITAQAFQASPVRHAPAAAIGLFPAIAAWGSVVVAGALTQAQFNPVITPAAAAQTVTSAPSTTTVPSDVGNAQAEARGPVANTPTMQDLLNTTGPTGGTRMELNGFLLHGMNIMERGYIFTCMILGAIAAFLIDRRFFQAARWAIGAAVLTFVGLMHAYQLSGNVVDYWLIFTSPAPGAFTYTAYPLVIGYVLMAGVFLFMGWLHRGQPTEATLDAARLVESNPAD